MDSHEDTATKRRSFIEAALAGSLSRRVVVQRGAALGLSTAALGTLLAACGGDDDADPTATTGSGTTGSATQTTGGATTTTGGTPATGGTPGAGTGTGEQRPAQQATGDNAIFNFGAIQEPVTLDPHLSTSVSDTMLMNIYEKLVDVATATGELEPQLSTAWEVSSDGLRVTWDLREGVKFQDGEPFNADAAIANFERCIALKSYIPESFEAIASMRKVDDLTLEVTLKQIQAPWVSMMSKNPKMISPKAIKDHTVGDDLAKTWLAENTVGCGAYTHKSWQRGSNLEWVAHTDYWRGWDGSHVTTVNNRIILEPGTQRLQVESGELDVQMLYTQDSLTALRRNPDLNVLGVDQPNILYIRLNNYDGPTADKRVRQAISHAFNYEEYQILLNYPTPPPRADMPVPTQLFGEGFEPVDIPYYEFDLDRAKSLMSEAGHASGFEMNIFTDPSSPQKPLLAEFFQAQMAQINIRVSITVEPFTNILARGTDQNLQRNWDTAIHSWILYTPPPYPDPSGVLLRMYTPYPNSIRNLLGYTSERVKQLTDEGLRSTDPQVSMQKYWEANLQIVEDCPDLILDRSIQFEILRKWIHGHIPHVLEPWRWTYWDIWKTKTS